MCQDTPLTILNGLVKHPKSRVISISLANKIIVIKNNNNEIKTIVNHGYYNDSAEPREHCRASPVFNILNMVRARFSAVSHIIYP